MSYIIYSALFDYTDLTTVQGLTVLTTNPYEIPQRKLAMGDLAQSSKSKVNSGFYNKKEIVVRVGITRTSRPLVEQSLDTLMGLLQGLEKDLVLVQSNNSRKYIATFSDAVTRVAGGSYLELDLIFTCSDRFGYDLAPTLLINNIGGTGSSRNDNFTLGGTADTQCPVWTITLTAVTGGTGASINIGNATLNQILTINRSWVAGDVLEVDAYNNTVKVNGVEVDYTGAIPYFAPSPSVSWITYTDTFTTRTISYKVTYVKRYV